MLNRLHNEDVLRSFLYGIQNDFKIQRQGSSVSRLFPKHQYMDKPKIRKINRNGILIFNETKHAKESGEERNKFVVFRQPKYL